MQILSWVDLGKGLGWLDHVCGIAHVVIEDVNNLVPSKYRKNSVEILVESLTT
jgi:hypothetical protein